jgi:hypothetical protein
MLQLFYLVVAKVDWVMLHMLYMFAVFQKHVAGLWRLSSRMLSVLDSSPEIKGITF